MRKKPVKVSGDILKKTRLKLTEWGCTPEQAAKIFDEKFHSLSDVDDLDFKENVGEMCIAITCTAERLFRKFPKKEERDKWIHTPRESGMTFLELVAESETPRETMLKLSEELL